MTWAYPGLASSHHLDSTRTPPLPPMDNIYFCEAFIRSVGAIGSNGKIYVLYEPEEDLGEIMLDWCVVCSTPLRSKLSNR